MHLKWKGEITMKWLQNLLGGLAGALALNILHESGKRLIPDAPRIDLVGEEALSKTMAWMGHEPPTGHKLFLATLGADVSSNALYYSMIGQGPAKHLLLRGTVLGLAAGIGALKLTEPAGLNDKPITRTTTSQVLTVALYLTGGLVAAVAIQALRGKK
jgi:hypothetical protein